MPATHLRERSAPFDGMAWVSGGTFLMGSDSHYLEEAPARRVPVGSFWMDGLATWQATSGSGRQTGIGSPSRRPAHAARSPIREGATASRATTRPHPRFEFRERCRKADHIHVRPTTAAAIGPRLAWRNRSTSRPAIWASAASSGRMRRAEELAPPLTPTDPLGLQRHRVGQRLYRGGG